MKSINCKEAVEFILKAEENKLTVRQRLSLWRHLLICNLCRTFSAQNRLINQAMTRRENKKVLSDSDKENIIRKALDDQV